MLRVAFDRLYAEGEESGRVVSVCLHPYLYGQPHRVKYLDSALSYMLDHDGVWVATGEEISEWAREAWLDAMAASEIE